MNIYIVCPVRNCSQEITEALNRHVAELEARGHSVHYPPRDVNQEDDGCGLHICEAHRAALKLADEVHIYWDSDSKGSLFDLGMAFMANSVRFRFINNPPRDNHKSYLNVFKALEL